MKSDPNHSVSDNNISDHIAKHFNSSACLLRLLLGNMPDNIYIKDEKSRFIYANPAFCDWTGMSLDEVLGKTDFDLFDERHAQPAFEDEQRIMETGKPLTGLEEKEIWPDGKVTWVSTSKMPLLSEKNEIIGTFGISRNITANKEMEGQLIQAQKLESVGQLAAGIAHEINTPIQFVGDNLRFLQDAIGDLLELTGSYAELIELADQNKIDASIIEKHRKLLDNVDPDYLKEELPTAVDQSLEGAQRVTKIVRAMKNFSHPGTEMAHANLNEAIETTITVAKNEWKYVSTVETDLVADLPSVPCLVSEFNQVILNMIVNARDAIEETGENGTIRISTSYDEIYAFVRISDTGAGMPVEVQKRIFDPFFTTKEVGKGSGQGLSIAHNLIVNKHGGALSVESQPGEGTTFIISLPLTMKTTESD